MLKVPQNKLFVTGDIHGDIDIGRLNTSCFHAAKKLNKNDYLIVAGDFGLPWSDSKEDSKWLKWLDKKSFTTFFVDGNHENFNLLNAYPMTNWCGGKVHQINNSVLHLMRGQVFEIHGKKIFTFGGATSRDKAFRREGSSWWPEELPSEEEMQEGLSNLSKHDCQVDYIVTHSAPSGLLEKLSYLRRGRAKPDVLTDYLESLYHRVQFKHWYFGQYHLDYLDENTTALYYGIVKI